MGLTENVTLFPHGATAPRHRPAIRTLHVSDEKRPLIGCHGFFLPGKGVDRLIRAAAELARTWPGLTLRLVNARFPDSVSDAEIDACHSLAAELGVADRIEWLTEFRPVDEISALLSECDLVVLPYDQRQDSASGAVRVALSSLTPVVVSPVSIFDELDESVERLASSAPADIAYTLDHLLRSPRARRDLQDRADAWLKTRDWDRLAPRLEGMLRGLVESARMAKAVEVKPVRTPHSVPA